MRGTARFALVVLFGATLPVDAFGAPTARLVYHRGEGARSCPDEDVVRAAVAARLGYDPFVPEASSTMFATLSKDRARYLAHLELVDERGDVRGARDLVQAGEPCADIIDTMALSMSIAIAPESAMGPLDATDATGPTAPSPPPRTTRARATSSAGRPSAAGPTTEPPSAHVQVGLSPSFAVGAAPSANVGASLFVRGKFHRWSLGLEARGDLPGTRSLDHGTVSTSLVFGTAAACAHVGVFGVCGLASLGTLRGSSRDVRAPREDVAFHAAVGPRVEADMPVWKSLSLRAHADGLLTLTPQTLQIDGRDVFALSRVSGVFGAGVAWEFF